MLGTHVQKAMKSLYKMGKEGEPHGKKPSPKREISTINKDAWMDGLIKTPPLWHTSIIYNRESLEEIPP